MIAINKDINPQKLSELLNKKGGEELKQAALKGDKKALLNSLSDTDRAMLYGLMQDKEARDKLMNSPEVQRLISEIFGKR